MFSSLERALSKVKSDKGIKLKLDGQKKTCVLLKEGVDFIFVY